METLLIRYGYALLFGGVLVEGEAVVLAAAFLAERGVFALPAVIGVAVLANTLADLAYFSLARRRGRDWLEKRYGTHRSFSRLLELVGRHRFLLLLVSRFAYGLRIAIPAACGALGMELLPFAVIDVLAGVLWAVPMALLGYSAGNALSSRLAGVERYEVVLGLALVATVAAVLAMRRLRSLAREGRLRLADLHAIVPVVVALVGALNLVTAIAPRSAASVAFLERWLPLEVIQRSRPLMLFAGLALLQVARNLGRRKTLAWGVATAALAVSVGTHLGHGFDFQHSLPAVLLLVYLVAFRRRFHARTDRLSLRRAVLMSPVLAGLVLAYGAVGLRHMEAQFVWPPGTTALGQAFRSGILVIETPIVPRTAGAARFLGSIEIAGCLGRLYLLVLCLRPVIARSRLEAPAEAVREALRAWARSSLASFAADGDKHHLLLAEGRGLVAYAVRGGVALAAGDPLTPEADLADGVKAYLAHCRSNGWTPCIYEASEEALPVYRALGLQGFKMAEEALVDLASFGLSGGARAGLRAMVNKATKHGLMVLPYDRAAAPDAAVDVQLDEISREWLAEKKLAEMGFTVGRFSLSALDGLRVFLCMEGPRVVGFCSWRSYRGGRAAVLDLMRKRTGAPSGAMDLLLAKSLLMLRDAGLEEASLANAPLANVHPPRGLAERAAALLFEKMNGLYGYKSLFQFKKKFAPRWEGRYLVYPRGIDLPRVAYAMATVHGAGGLRQLLGR